MDGFKEMFKKMQDDILFKILDDPETLPIFQRSKIEAEKYDVWMRQLQICNV